MAHTVIMTRGPIKYVNEFINDLNTRYLPFKKYNKKTKKMEDLWLQMRVCPVQLWDLSYPVEHRDAIHNTIFQGGNGNSIHKRHQNFLCPIRKAMKLDKIPNYDRSKKLVMPEPQNIEMIGIGVKDDYFITEDDKHVSFKDKTPLSYEGI